MTTTNGTAINVFISYAHEDEALLERLHTHLSSLTQPGRITTWYDRELVAGSDWAGGIDAHLEQADIILLLVSADFIASRYCYQIEMTRALERHEAGQACVIPIALRPADWKDMPFASLHALPTDARPVTSWSNQDEAWVNVVAGIRRAIADLTLLPASTAHKALPPIWNIPYPRNTFFLGRDELLERLHVQLQAGQTTALSQSPQAISGLGGIGKTQLAIEYAYRYAHDYEAVLWTRAETREELIASYSTLAALLKLPEQHAGDQEITIEAVKRWLQTHQKWLLILDNADDLELLPPFLPPIPGGHILLTTRAYDMRRLATRLEVETLPTEQGALLLLRRAGLLLADGTLEQATEDERRLARALTTELGGLPLALDQAGAYLEATGMSLDDYQRIYQTHRKTLLNERRSLVEDHPAPVATTWSLSFERIEEKNPAAADLLRLGAYLAPDAIPETIVTEGAEHLGDQLAPVAVDAFLFAQAIEALRAYSLLTRDPRTKTLSVHRLVQAVTQDSLPAEAAQQWKQRAVLAVCAARPDASDVQQWPACERWLPHALLCADWIEQEQISSPEVVLLLNYAGYYLKQRGRYREVEPLYQRGLAIDTEVYGPEHPDVATALNNLASLYHDQGKYELAEPLLQRALAIYEQQLGALHPDTATSLNNLASLYRAQGKYAEAEPLCQRALAIFRQQLGPHHPFIATSLNNLALLYYAQGKYEQAEPLLQRALAILEQTLGDEHPNTQAGRRNYAALLRAMGREEEARRVEGEL